MRIHLNLFLLTLFKCNFTTRNSLSCLGVLCLMWLNHSEKNFTVIKVLFYYWNRRFAFQ